MKIVLDTNALLMSIPKKSPYRPIFDGLISGDYVLCLTNEILSEYTEIISQRANPVVANNIAEMLLNLKNVEKVDVYFKWGLIEADWDDNKFVDCAIAGNAKFIVTNDKHFNVLAQIGFPKIDTANIKEFLSLLES